MVRYGKNYKDLAGVGHLQKTHITKELLLKEVDKILGT